ncbi:Flp family type IVb pilin [Arthrobacter cupressi]|uniref:Pilus assembly protein Flp/PilA n=1 Tax=Arthrobacter cupressi TaxID=1045773 RepID=A0A1G8MSV0_9MICC|nr:Flp family type IVb pilin [Arthrobacter cupressi]NYD76923.1 pilus assembly protein Flp/PilA [Arthrobacter cupressi]SDI70984.1 pilus assembly protein Flp/PilA [Arthrobacter cupressi]
MSSLMLSVVSYIAGLKDRLTSEKGATATEYSLLIAFIAFAIIVGVGLFGTELNAWFTDLSTTVDGWQNGQP